MPEHLCGDDTVESQSHSHSIGSCMLALSDALQKLEAALGSNDCETVTRILQLVFPGLPRTKFVKSTVDLARIAQNKGDLGRAGRYYQLAIDLQESCFPSAYLDARTAKYQLIEVLEAQGHLLEASRLKEELNKL